MAPPVGKDLTEISETGRCSRAQATACRGSAGFTLVELLVVLLILGIMSSFIALSTRPDARQEAATEATRLRVILEAALQDAQLTGRPLAWVPQMVGQNSGYRFVRGDLERRWQAVTDDDQFRPRQFPEGMRVAGMAMDGQAIPLDSMLILPSNGAPAFRIDLDSPQGRYTLRARPNGRVDLLPPKTE